MNIEAFYQRPGVEPEPVHAGEAALMCSLGLLELVESRYASDLVTYVYRARISRLEPAIQSR